MKISFGIEWIPISRRKREREREWERERERESYLKHRLSVEIGGKDFTHVIEKGAHGLKGGDDVV